MRPRALVLVVLAGCQVASHDFEDGVDAGSEPAVLTISQGAHVFGDVATGQASATLDVFVTNTGGEVSGAISLALSGDGAAQFELVGGCDGETLAPADSCTAQVRFAPSAAGVAEASLDASATPGGVASLDLSGTGLTPGDLAITAGESLDFGIVEIASSSEVSTVTVINNGGSPTAPLDVTLADADNFAIVADGCDGVALGAGVTCDVQVRFDPTLVGSLPTQLSIRESAFVGVAASVAATGSARLQIAKSGVGTVTSSPTGMKCGSGCANQTVEFVQSPILLTATPDDADHVFGAWSGACDGDLDNVCSVALTEPLTAAGVTFTQLACTPNTIVCDDDTDHYVDCDGSGSVEFEMDCPLGCASGMEKCQDLDPSNGMATYLDMTATAPVVAFAGSSTIDTTSGNVFNGGVSVTVPSVVVGAYRVFMFKSMSIAAGATLRASGSKILVIVADGDVTIAGLLDASSDGSYSESGVVGPGGIEERMDGSIGSLSQVSPGAGGGGHYDDGGDGGNAGDGQSGGQGYAGSSSGFTLKPGVTGPATIETQHGVCFKHPGRGGGAVQISSRTKVALTGNGKIDASGGGATNTVVCGDGTTSGIVVAGAGGGSGGSVLLEAPQVILDGASVVISTKGGGGSAAGESGCSACKGADGGTAAGAATAGNGSGADGGAGGTEAAAPGNGGNGAPTSGDGGGGGGSVGKARFHTTAGTINPQNGAAIRSRYTSGTLATRLVP